jgi:hypothetical protein
VSSASRRAQRKSTLTQQQRNHKRQRATQDQLVTLELEFNKNPTPTAAVRERIAQEINMTERSVQIWFQNRRAKIKMIAKKSIETGEDCDSIPESMRQYLAMHFDPNKTGGRDLFGRTGGLAGYGSSSYSSESTHSGKIVIHHFTCRSLSIGSWRRLGQNAMDLVIFYSPDKATMTYYINNDSAGYKIEYPFSHIKNITLEPGDPTPTPTGALVRPGGLVVELNRPPLFYMDCSNSGGFYQCGDFTEDQQASRVLVHNLWGHPKVLSVQLAKLVSLESFQNRLAFSDYAASAPVSPHIIHRPASQPNQFVSPAVNVVQDSNHLGVNLAARGHKRQRSRSVPTPFDYSRMSTSRTPFHMPPQQHQAMPPNPSFFAPIPQHHPVPPPVTHLRLDTTADYGMDLRTYPMSATTTASMPDFMSPSLFTTGPPSESISLAPSQGNQYNVPFISIPTIDRPEVNGPPTSPLQNQNPVSPLIADHSPPLSMMHVQTPTDMFSLSTEMYPRFPEDGLMLTEMYSKHNISVPLSASVAVDASTFDLNIDGVPDHSSPGSQGGFSGVMAFDTVDPSALATAS